MPIALLKDPSIASESKVLAGLLIAYDGPKGCFPKIASLMKDLGSSKHTVIRCLEELERYGFLKRERRGRNNVYHLTPAYVQPARPDDITLTGELAVENMRPARPVKRRTLHNHRPDPALRLDEQQVAPEQPIPISRRKQPTKRVSPVQPISGTIAGESVAHEQPERVASVLPVVHDRLHESNLDITENQRSKYIQLQQDAAAGASTSKAMVELELINAGIAPYDAVLWAADLIGLNPADIAAALKIMRAKPAYRRREIDRPGAYMRTLCSTAVPMERELAEHRRRGGRSAEIHRLEGIHSARATTPVAVHEPVTAPAPARPVAGEFAKPPADDGISVIDQLAQLDDEARAAVTARALQIARGGPSSPAWRGAVSIAMQQFGLIP